MDQNKPAQQSISLVKKQLRLSIKNSISAVSEENRNAQSAAACKRFLSSKIYQNAKYVLSYMAMSFEINPFSISQKALADSKILALPRTVPHTSNMQFYTMKNTLPLEQQLEEGVWGIREPFADEKNILVLPEDAAECIVVVPGVAFTKEGFRLGHGRGYYDRYLSILKRDCMQKNIQLAFIGMCLEEQVTEKIPVDENDLTMDYLLTAESFSVCRCI